MKSSRLVGRGRGNSILRGWCAQGAQAGQLNSAKQNLGLEASFRMIPGLPGEVATGPPHFCTGCLLSEIRPLNGLL